MHRKRCLKQIGTTLGFFKNIRPHGCQKAVLKEYQDIDIKLDRKRVYLSTDYFIYEQGRDMYFTEGSWAKTLRNGFKRPGNFRKWNRGLPEIDTSSKAVRDIEIDPKN